MTRASRRKRSDGASALLTRGGAALDPATAECVAETFHALGDPTRVRLVYALCSSEMCVGDLAASVGMTHSAVSHQLATLRGLRIVRSRRAGRRVLYRLDDAHVESLLAMAVEHARHAPRGRAG